MNFTFAGRPRIAMRGRQVDSAGAEPRIGIIAPVTRPFCGACSRLRITADGKIRPCLFSLQEWDIRPVLRETAGGGEERDGAEFTQRLGVFSLSAVWNKQAGPGSGS